MKIIKRIFKLSTFVNMFLLFTFFVYGRSYSSSIQNALSPVLDVFAGVFGLTNDPFYGLVLMKVILWLIVLNLFTLAIRRTPMWGDETTQKNAKIIATLLSLAGVLVIPGKTIEGLFFYIGIVFIVGLVVVIIQMINGLSNNQGSITGGWVGIGIGVAMISVALIAFSVSPYNTTKVFFDLTLFDLMFIAGLGVIIYGIVTLFKGGGNNTLTHRTTNTPTTNNNPRQPTNPPQNANQLQQQLNAFGQSMQQFMTAYNDFLNNPLSNPNGAPYTGVGQIQEVIKLSNAVVRAANAVSQNITNINSNQQLLQALPQQQQQQYQQVVSQFLALYNQHMVRFNNALIRRI